MTETTETNLILSTADLLALPVSETDRTSATFVVGKAYVCEAATGLCCRRTNEVGRRRIVAVVEGIRKGKQGNLLDLTVHDQVKYKGEVRRMTYTMRGVRCQRCRHRGDREMTIVVERNTYYGWWLDSSRMVAVGG